MAEPKLNYERVMAYRPSDIRVNYGERECILYALGIGAGMDPLDPGELVAAVTGHAAPAAAPAPAENTAFDVKEAEKLQGLWWYLLLAGLLLLAAETVVSNRLSQGERFL